jgi:carbohydrate-selective porin OprB
VNRFGVFFGGGVTAKRFVVNRPNDEFGIGFVGPRNGDHYLKAQANLDQREDDQEVTVELPYLAPIASWLSIGPNLQYVINPNTDPRRRDAIVGLIRVEVSF